MTTKKESTSTAQFDPTSMNAFTSMQGGIASVLNDWMKNPGQIQNLLLQQGYRQNARVGGRMNSNVLNNAVAGGWGGGNLPAFLQASIARNSRATSANNANTFLQTLLGTKQMQLTATGMAQNYRPLQTGSKQVEQTSGLGTWLPQVIGAGLGMATGLPMFGGAAAAAGGAAKAGGGMLNFAPTSNVFSGMSNPFLDSNGQPKSWS